MPTSYVTKDRCILRHNNNIYERAKGTANDIILTMPELYDGYWKKFIASNDSTGNVTINGKNLYKVNTTTPPKLKKSQPYEVYYSMNDGCFFSALSSGGTVLHASGTALPEHVLTGKTFSNNNGTNLAGTMSNLTQESAIRYATDNNTKVIKADAVFQNTNTDNVNRICLRYNGKNGYITGNTLFGIPATNLSNAIGLTPDKIVEGVTIGGITGTVKPSQIYCNIRTVKFVKYQSNVIDVDIGFRPQLVIVRGVRDVYEGGANVSSYCYIRCEATRYGSFNGNGFVDYATSVSTNKDFLSKIVGFTNTGFKYRMNHYSSDGKMTSNYDETILIIAV